VFKFYTELSRQNYNNIYIQEPVNSRVVEFWVVLTSVTNLRDRFGLYSLTGSMSVSKHVYVNCYMRHWTDAVFVRKKNGWFKLTTVKSTVQL